MYRCFQPDARANLPSIAITAHSLHLHIGVESCLSRQTANDHNHSVITMQHGELYQFIEKKIIWLQESF